MPDNAGISVSHKLFAPRVGIAYRLGDKTVIRAGYGINYDPIPFSRPLRGWYPLVINQANTRRTATAGPAPFAQGVPNTQGPDLSTGIVPLPGNVDERSPNSFIHRGYVQSWNVTVERKLPARSGHVRRLRRHAFRAPAGGSRHQRRLPWFRHHRPAAVRHIRPHRRHQHVGRLSELRTTTRCRSP